jgi:pectin methylesterase-like acyl-CoA thioesterase
MNNKIMIIGITLLFLILSSITNISLGNSSNNIIYVDDDGGADYTRIQDAIDNSSDRDIIFVYNGIYHESIQINKSSIQLKGESKHSTIIDGFGSNRIIFITGSWISISNFTITNCSDLGIGIQMGDFLSSNHITLDNNIISNIGYGIISPSTLLGFENRHLNHRIINNEIRNSRICAIEFHVTDSSIIQNNNFIQNRLAINLEWSNGNIIENNNFIENEINTVFDSSLFTKCSRNYYSNHEKKSPYIIHGALFEIEIPWFIIDWHPLNEPYDL